MSLELFMASVDWVVLVWSFFFFFNDTATTEIYTLSLHDALPISIPSFTTTFALAAIQTSSRPSATTPCTSGWRSEEHTSELQSPCNLVCRLLLEKKKKIPRFTLHIKQNHFIQLGL